MPESLSALELRLAPGQYRWQAKELILLRPSDPPGAHIGTGFFEEDLHLDRRLKNQLTEGIKVCGGLAEAWQFLARLLRGFARERMEYVASGTTESFRSMVVAMGRAGKGEAVALLVREKPELLAALNACLKSGVDEERRWGASTCLWLGNEDEAVTTVAHLLREKPELLAALMASLKSGLDEERHWGASTCRGLGHADEALTEGLVALLDDDNRDVRLKAAHALMGLGRNEARVVAEVISEMSDADPDLLCVTAIAETCEPKPEVFEALVPLLKSRRRWVRRAAADVLGRLAKTSAQVVDRLLALLTDDDSFVRDGAAAALASSGNTEPSTLHGLVRLLKDSNFYVVQSAYDSLSKLGAKDPGVAEVITPLLNDSDAAIRRRAVDILGACGPSGVGIIDALVRCLGDESKEVCLAAVSALTGIGLAKPNVSDRLITCLKTCLGDESKEVRSAAVSALTEIGLAKPNVVEELIACLKDSAWSVRDVAAQKLAELGPEDDRVIPALLGLVKDNSSFVRQHTAEALGRLGWAGGGVVEGLVALSTDQWDSVRSAASIALARVQERSRMGGRNPDSPVNNNQSVAADGAVNVTENAAFSEAVDLESLVASLTDTNGPMRHAAMDELQEAEVASPEVVEGLLKLLNDEDVSMRQLAAETVGKLGQQRKDWTDEHLIALLEHNLSSWRRAAAAVLAQREKLNASAREAVKARLDHPRPWVRLAAWDALVEIEGSRRSGTQLAGF